jgi:hypothetical protein
MPRLIARGNSCGMFLALDERPLSGGSVVMVTALISLGLVIGFAGRKWTYTGS